MNLADGYLLKLPRDQAKPFFGLRDDASRLEFLKEFLSKDDTGKLCLDGTWQAVHDALSAVSMVDSVLSQCILGGRPMHASDEHHIFLVRPDVVGFIAQQGTQLGEQLDAMPSTAQPVLDFYKEAAEAKAAVVFLAGTS